MYLFGKLFYKAKRTLRKFVIKPRSNRLYDVVWQQDNVRPITKKELLVYIVHPCKDFFRLKYIDNR